MKRLAVGFDSVQIGSSMIVLANCFEWLTKIPENTLHAVVTDPPHGVKEYESDQIEQRMNGKRGIWRLPPSFDGHDRAPLPRFTALSSNEKAIVRQFFLHWGVLVGRALRPGGHVILASNSYLLETVLSALVQSGLEFRGSVIRLVKTFRGGDRPKNSEREFPHVSSMPRSCHEPWAIFRKPIPKGMTISHCLREFGTGGLRRTASGSPFSDVIASERTPQREREVSPHPNLKPQAFLRQLVYVALPLGTGFVADPFMGGGSTIAAAEALGIQSVGIERHEDYFELSKRAIPKLAALYK